MVTKIHKYTFYICIRLSDLYYLIWQIYWKQKLWSLQKFKICRAWWPRLIFD